MACHSFVVLIGSQARGDATSRSDCDLLVIGSEYNCGELPSRFPGAPVNSILVSDDIFSRWYENGSLLLQHAFLEGVLLAGSSAEWRCLRDNFRVQTDFTSELLKIRAVTDRFWDTAKFGGKFLWPLVNAHSLIKNASIFRLAHSRTYVFNKQECVRRALGDRNELKDLLGLVDFYDYSTREIDIPLPFDPNDTPRCTRVLRSVAGAVKELTDEIA